MFNRLEGELDARENALGLRMSDLIELPVELRKLLNWILREKQVNLAQVSEHIGQGEAAARALIEDALDRGYLRQFNIRAITHYRVRLAPRRTRSSLAGIWEMLDGKVETRAGDQ